ncbi:MAG TPA: DinB family protein, partial [Vicinamibacteria bacterium]
RPAPGRHSVWELAVHAAYWKYAVRRLLTGEKRGSFPFAGSNWFPRPAGDPSDAAFKADLAVLAQQHRLLVQAVSQVRRAELEKKAPGSQYTRSRLIQGAAAHDLYHAGQIQLLKRLRP